MRDRLDRLSRSTCCGACCAGGVVSRIDFCELRRGDLKSPRLRLFVALELPHEGAGHRSSTWREQALGGVPDAATCSPRESLHVTLVFLGYQAERDVDRIAEICFTARAGPRSSWGRGD